MAGLLSLMKRIQGKTMGRRNQGAGANNSRAGNAGGGSDSSTRNSSRDELEEREDRNQNELLNLAMSAAIVFAVLYFLGETSSSSFNPDHRKLNNVLYDIQEEPY